MNLLMQALKRPLKTNGIKALNTNQLAPNIVIPNFNELKNIDADLVDFLNNIYVIPIQVPINKVQKKVKYLLV
jgi:hypothetical protein